MLTSHFRIGLIKKWKVRNGHLATYRQLTKSLFEAGAIDSVHTLCQELGAPRNPLACPAPSQPPPTPVRGINLMHN